jgi:hypothetical protein
MSYTLPQAQAFLAAIDRSEKRRQRDWLLLMRASQAPKEEFGQMLEGLK